MATILSVNINKVALLRNSREGNTPSLIEFARTSIEAGARSITVHPRPDQRHIRATDIGELALFLQDYPEIEFNIEGNPFAAANGDYPGFMALVKQAKPTQATLVPDTDQQLTSDHGFNLKQSANDLTPVIKQLHDWGVRVSLFMDPDTEQIQLAKQSKADRIELYTGPFAESAHLYRTTESHTAERLFQSYQKAAAKAHELGLGINAGHDLSLDNLKVFLTIPHIAEVSIGHALTIDALRMGYANAVKRYCALCQNSA